MNELVAVDAFTTCSLTITVTLPFALVAGYYVGKRRRPDREDRRRS